MVPSRSFAEPSLPTAHCPLPTARYEQAVYGSFPFWDRGYALLAASAGCRPEWLAEFRAACQRYGEPPRGVTAAGAIFCRRLRSGPWAIVGVALQGEDDRGRPGALAFHGLFVGRREFRKVGFDPFALAGALRSDWGPGTILGAGTWTVGLDTPSDLPPPLLGEGRGEGRSLNHPPPDPHPNPLPGGEGTGAFSGADELAGRIAAALSGGHRVAVASATPIDGLARRVWAGLPARVRRRASVATLAFQNADRFDLVALPKLGAADLDASYQDADRLAEMPTVPPTGRRWARSALAVAAGAAALALAVGLRRATRPEVGGVHPSATIKRPAESPSPGAGPIERPPDPADFDEPIAPEERRLALDGMSDLASRFGLEEEASDPAGLMARLAERVRYRGPLLSTKERAALAADGGPDAARALAWDRQIRRFLDDRPLPESFADGPLRWQLATLAWSFHIETGPGRSAAELPYDLADSLSLDAPARPSPLAGRHLALADYARFLARLPRR